MASPLDRLSGLLQNEQVDQRMIGIMRQLVQHIRADLAESGHWCACGHFACGCCEYKSECRVNNCFAPACHKCRVECPKTCGAVLMCAKHAAVHVCEEEDDEEEEKVAQQRRLKRKQKRTNFLRTLYAE